MRSVRLSLIALILVLHGSVIEAATPPRSSSNVIRVWTVGSPHRDDLPAAVVPSALRQKAESLGYTIEVENFRAAGFAGKFRQALQEHNEPEILTFDNYGIVAGITTASGWYEGVATDPRMASSLVLVHEALASLQQRGWVMLVRSAANYEAAKTLSTQPAVCDSQSGPVADAVLRLAQEKAVFAARAYLGCDKSSQSVISDESRLGQKCFLPDSDTQVESVKACRVSGNRNLAFVDLVSNFSAQVRVLRPDRRLVQSIDLGQQSILAVLRNQGGDWKVLAITHDPINTVLRTHLTTNTLDRLLDDAQTAGIAPESARLLTPDGVFPLPARNERFGNFVWQPSQSADVIGQVVEFLIGKEDSRGFTRLFFLPARESKLSTGYLMSGGKSMWRVWSVAKTGDIAFSEQHSYTH